MGNIAREIVERAGIDVGVLIGKLASAARAELATYYRYTIFSIQSQDRQLRDILDDIRAEDRRHFDALITRVHELDGRLPPTLGTFAAGLPHDETPDDLLATLIDRERQAVAAFSDLYDFTEGKDHRTCDLALAILNEETEHEAWLCELLGADPPARFRRGFRGRSPYLTRLSSGTSAGPR